MCEKLTHRNTNYETIYNHQTIGVIACGKTTILTCDSQFEQNYVGLQIYIFVPSSMILILLVYGYFVIFELFT